MIFTKEQLRQCSDFFSELSAKSIGSFPSEFGVVTGNDEINRVFRLEVSDAIDFAVAFLRKYHTAAAIPSDFDPASLPSDKWTVTDPMMDTETHEGKYRHVALRVYRQFQDGREHFYIIQTLAKGHETTAVRTYSLEVANPSSPVPDITDVKFYDSGIEYGGETVHYSEGDAYAKWNHSEYGWIVSEVSELGQTPDNYFDEASGTYTGTGAWTGTFTFDAISEVTVDLSKFRLATSDYYHANHAQPILRLENVSPSSSHDICEQINQDTFTDIVCFDETLEGTWYRRRVRSEVQDDGSHHIFLMLSDAANSELYFKYQATPSIIRGYYYKWETTNLTIDELMSTIRFEPDGEIDEAPYTETSRTLQQVVEGRTVVLRRGMRDEDDRLFDLEIEISWTAGNTEEPDGDFYTEYGEPLQKKRLIRHVSGETLPNEEDLLGRYVSVLWNPSTEKWDTVADGTENALTGRRLIRTETERERVEGGVISYDLYEVEITAPMDKPEKDEFDVYGTVDQWFYSGGAKTPERSIRTAYSGFADQYGDSFPPGQYVGNINSNYISIFFTEYRVAASEKNLKWFVRQPTNEDLTKAGAIQGIVEDSESAATVETAVEISRPLNRVLYSAIKLVTITGPWAKDEGNAPNYGNTVGSMWSNGFDYPNSSIGGTPVTDPDPPEEGDEED